MRGIRVSRLSVWLRRQAASQVHADDPPIGWIWSKGIARFCDMAGGGSYWMAGTEDVQTEAFFAEHYAGAAGIVWLRLGTGGRDGLVNDLDRFASVVLPTIEKPFVLVTTDGDLSVPGDVAPATQAAILASPFLVAWATQNHDGGGAPCIRPFPIGLDFHSPRPFTSPSRLARDLFRIADASADIQQRKLRVFCDALLSLNCDERRGMKVDLAGCPNLDILEGRISQKAVWRRYAEAPFVLSPRGNGFDCHRTWEALALGSIVVARRGPLDALYEDLAVAIVDDWREIADISRLQRWREELAPLTRPEHVRPRLQPAFWLEPLRRILQEAESPARGAGLGQLGRT